MLNPLSKDRVLCSDGDVDQPLCYSIPRFCESPFSRGTLFLIWPDAEHRLAQHFYIHLLLFLYGPMYVRLNHVMMELYSFYSSVLQLVARDAQRPQGNSPESA